MVPWLWLDRTRRCPHSVLMPIYEYRCDNPGCPQHGQRYERLQRLNDDSAAACPACGAAGQRVISAPRVTSGGSHRLKEQHFSKHGFTQYKRLEKGVYEKTAGRGPDIISDPGD